MVLDLLRWSWCGVGFLCLVDIVRCICVKVHDRASCRHNVEGTGSVYSKPVCVHLKNQL